MPRPTPSRLFLLVCAALMTPSIAFLGLHVLSPSDGARMDPTVDSWRRDGIVLTPIEPEVSPLRAGDVLVAVEGQSLEAWAGQLLRFDQSRPKWEFGQTVLYTVRREGALWGESPHSPHGSRSRISP
ncbi:MAG: hypothetical protein WD040_04220 [Anaerolineales bacterium]